MAHAPWQRGGVQGRFQAVAEQFQATRKPCCRWCRQLESLVCGREYVQAETGLDAETFDGRYDVCSMDMEPITWANYKSFLPSETAPVMLRA